MVILPFKDKAPVIADDAYISERASIIGAATIGARTSVWEYAVIRADTNTITVGEETSIQDNCTVHGDVRFPVKIGNRVVMGHNAVVHGCTIENNVIVGIGAVILNGAHIGHHSIVGAGCVVTPGTKVPPESLVLGIPGKVIRSLNKADRFEVEHGWQVYVGLSRQYLDQRGK
ncbi:MAG: gamma carbonic anhydrase family protein [Promethearchaeota archaeon]